MDALNVAAIVLYPVFSALAWLVARHDRAHRWVAAFATWMVAVDLVRRPLLALLARSPHPRHGLARAAYHLDELLVLSWYYLFLAACVHYFLRRRPHAVLGAWAATWLLCLNYPLFSRDVVLAVYRTVSLGCLIGSWLVIFGGMFRKIDIRPTLSHLTLIFYATVDVVINLIPYTHGFVSAWPLVRLANVVLLLACCGAHLSWLVARHRAART